MKRRTNESADTEGALAFLLSVVAIAILGGLVMFGMWGCPQWNVYSQRMDGQAMLAHAQSAKEVAVAEAKAKNESAVLLAEAEVKRAHGVAQANEIIGNSLKGNDAYLRYLWIMEVAANQNGKTTVYVPTEASLPILEATREHQ